MGVIFNATATGQKIRERGLWGVFAGQFVFCVGLCLLCQSMVLWKKNLSKAMKNPGFSSLSGESGAVSGQELLD